MLGRLTSELYAVCSHAVGSLASCNRIPVSNYRRARWLMGGWLHKREERKLRRACHVSGELASVQGLPGQRAAAWAASCTRLARMQSLAPCNCIPVNDRWADG